MRKILTALLAFTVGVLTACGGGGHHTPPAVSLSISPNSVNVIAGQTQQFTAIVTNSTNTAVTWSVFGSSCSGAACGTIDANGIYTAPSPIPASATVTIVATASADNTKSVSATITQLPVSIALPPNSNLALISADTRQFSAIVSNAPTGHATVHWSISGDGSIDEGGLYSAPAKVLNDSTVMLIATSDFDKTKTASMTFSLKAPVITLSPGDISMEAGAQLHFTATVTNVPAGQNGVTWALNGNGSLISGHYSSPALVSEQMTAMIQAISAFDDTKVAHSVVTIGPVGLFVSPKSVTLYPEQTQQFKASVTNHVNKGVTWSIAGESCVAEVCGTVDANGLYTAPSSIPGEMDVVVTATSTADTSKSDGATVTLKPVTVTISPKTATVKLGMTQQFNGAVLGGRNLSVTWSVSGSDCNGNTCGTIDSNGLYTAPPALPTSATVTVKATSVVDATRFDTATVTLISDPNVKLNGAYAFTFTGWEPGGVSLDMIGSMLADGNGHLTGLMDMNGLTYLNHNYHAIKQTLTGTYQVNAGDNRGVMWFNVASETFMFRFAISSTGDRGSFLLMESGGRYGAGWFKRQIPSDFSLSSLNGDYVMGLSALSIGGDERDVAIARGHLDGLGGISNTSLDISGTNGSTGQTTFTGSVAMSSATGASFGRGNITVTAQGSTINLSFYLIDSTEAYMMVSDAAGQDMPILMGRFLKQAGQPYSSWASFDGPIVVTMIGMLSTPPHLTSSLIAQYNVSVGTGFGTLFENWGGQQVNTGGSIHTYNIDATTGRAGIGMSSFSDPFVAYFVAPNTGFIMEYAPVGGGARFGFFEPQSPGPFSNATLSGEYFGGSMDPATSSVPYGNGIENFDGNGGWGGIGHAFSPYSAISIDQYVVGTYSITDSASGKGSWIVTSPGTYHKTFYVISPNKIVLVPAETAETSPGMEVLEK